jgi:hypothetical protein
MHRTSYVPILSALLALVACENPLGPAASLDVELTVQADDFIPGQAVPITIALHNPTSRTIEVADCAVGIEVRLPDGEVVKPAEVSGVLELAGLSLAENPCRSTLAVAPSDAVVFHGVWTGYGVDAAGDSTLSVPLGTYELRPYLVVRRPRRGRVQPERPPFTYGLYDELANAADAVLYGPSERLPMVPWTRARFMHSYAGVPSVDVLVDGRLAAKALEPGGLSLVEPVVAGTAAVEIRLAGGTVPLSTTSMVFSEGLVHTIVLRAGPQGPEPWDVTDTTAHPGPTESALRVIHLATAAPDIVVFRTQPDRPDPVPILSPFPYGTASRYVLGGLGRWTVVVTANAGTDTLLVAPVELKGGELRTMLLMDDGQGGAIGPSIIP